MLIRVLMFWVGLQGLAAGAQAVCRVEGLPVQAKDSLAVFVQGLPTCPTSGYALRTAFRTFGYRLQTTQVANRGFHNPGQGSFSFFEMATLPGRVEPGELFFGHFTEGTEQGELVLQDRPAAGALLIEAISWDEGAGVFRFYELVGERGGRTQWFYRGDSHDIASDLNQLHLARAAGQPAFGNRLRCSGCHLGGGPIMKELTAPHNDWWTKQRGLPLAHTPDARVAEIFQDRVEPGVLAQAVQAAMEKLTKAAKPATDLRVALRPLFCPLEVNLESDVLPLSDASAVVQVPTGLFIDPRLLPAGITLTQPKTAYLQALRELGAVFPETRQRDADHAWLGPVKGYADQLLIQRLVEQGQVDEELVADVLAVDLTHPFASPERCGLLQALPAQGGPEWKMKLVTNLRQQGTAAAQLLVQNLEDPARDQAFHRAAALTWMQQVQQRLANPSEAVKLLWDLNQRRESVRSNEISQNPRGQILEPGFRVIFPKLVSP